MLALAAASVLLATPAGAQERADSASAGAATASPVARPEDVESIDAIIAALYDVISGPAGPRDWDRMRSLFAPGARLIPAQTSPSGEGATSRVLTIDGYIERAGGYFQENAFYETELHRVEESFGNVAHAFSTYASRHAPDDPEPFVTGVNSIQLVRDGGRWWVTSIAWDEPRADNPIPARYLP